MAEKKQKKSGRQNYDWNAIKLDYVTTPDMTLRKIAAKYGIRLDTVAHKSKAEGWFATRKEHQTKVVTKAITKAADLQAKELADEAELLTLMKGHVSRALKDSSQFNRHIKVDPVTGDLSEEVLDKIDARAVKDLMQVTKMIEDMTRSLYNIQKAEALLRSKIEAERLAIERERLELEKARQEFRNQSVSGDESKYGIVLIPEVLDDGE